MELNEIAKKMCAKGKGILAADESTGTIAKRFKSINVENLEKNRLTFRQTLFSASAMKDYIGGVLAPGVELSLKNLIDKASLIPKIKLEKTANVIGKNTKSAVRAGFYHGYTGLIENIIKLILIQTRKKFKIILTGGFAHLFKSSIKGIKTVDKNLTIKGILRVAIN